MNTFRTYFGLGRRGVVLALFGVIYGLVGLAYLTIPMTDTQQETLQVALAAAPQQAWGAVWTTAGFTALTAAGFRRINPGMDVIGYVMLTAISSLWAGMFGMAGLLFGVERAWLGFLVYGAMASLLQIVAGWPEDPGKIPRAERRP